MFHIQDWIGNIMYGGKTWSSWDDAEDYLAEQLDDDYETDRGEYFILEAEERDHQDNRDMAMITRTRTEQFRLLVVAWQQTEDMVDRYPSMATENSAGLAFDRMAAFERHYRDDIDYSAL